MSIYVRGLVGIGVLALGISVANMAAAADLTIGGTRSASLIVTPDDQWMDPTGWSNRADKVISSWQPERQNMVYGGAALFQEYLRKITGKELAIVSETEWEKQGKPAAVMVGPTRFAVRQFGSRLSPDNLKRSGYVAKSIPDRLMVCGVNPWGTYAGCGAILEEQCGVEWFWPTELGEEVPAKQELTFDRLDITFQPAIAFSSGMMDTWGARLGERPAAGFMGGHSLGPNIYHAGRLTNPEWFPLLQNQRDNSEKYKPWGGWQPCMASPTVLERAATAAKKHFREHPDAQGFSLILNDGSWTMCGCDYCQAANTPADPAFDTTPYHVTGGASALYYRFLWQVGDAIQAEFPGRFVEALAYAGNDLPPEGLPRNPNVHITVVGTKLAWLNPEFRKWEELRHQRFARLTPNLGSYDYMYQCGFIPVYAPHLDAEVVRFLHKNGYSTAYAETYQTMARSGPRYWLHLKLCNDPDSDVDALLDRWMRGMFKEAAAPMADYYQAIEAAWVNYPYHEYHTDAWSTYCFDSGVRLPVLTPETVARMDKDLDQAERLAQDAKVKARLAVIRKNYTPTREAAQTLWRTRPYIDPVPFDDTSVLADLTEYALGQPLFDAKAYYEKYCRDDMPLSRMGANLSGVLDTRTLVVFDSTPFQRLGRAIDGLVDKPLREAAAKTVLDWPGMGQAVAARVESFAAKAKATSELKGLLVQLAGKVISVKRVATGPRLDGDFSDPCWQSLKEYQGFAPDLTGVPDALGQAHSDTSFKVCHDDQSFYFAVVCRQKGEGLVTKATHREDSAIQGDDRIVISMEPWQYRFRGSSGRVKVSVTAGGIVSEDGGGYGTKFWNPGARAVSRKTDDGYVLEVAVPFKALLYSPERGALVRFNLQRFVQGPAPEVSAWYPENVGDTYACVELGDAGRLVRHFDQPTATPLNTESIRLPMEATGWQFYVLSAPASVVWPAKPGEPATTDGRQGVLVSERFLDIQAGHNYEVEVEYTGEGKCVPALNWFSRTETGFEDLFDAVKADALPIEEGRKRMKVARVRLTAPGKADAARVRLTCDGKVRIKSAKVVSRFPLDIRIDIDSDAGYMAVGQVLAVQATIRNVSDKPIEGLAVRMGYPTGADLRSQAVSAATALKPGESTHALWWLTPVYGAGAQDFVAVVIVEAKDMPRIVAKARGPLPRGAQVAR